MEGQARRLTAFCLSAFLLTSLLTACFGGKAALSSGRGGEVTGVGAGKGFTEPTPFGMTLVKRGFLKMGIEKQDSLWGMQTPVKEISVDGFWMDETEVTNAKYKQFVQWVRDSILRERLAALPLPLRWSLWLLGLLAVLIFGVYGPGYNRAQFIYMGF